MEWPKLKNIILIILAITNVFLLGLVGLREWNSAQYRREARENALQVLEQNGIRMDPAALPADQTLSVSTVTREREKEAGVLTPLLETVEEEAEGGGRYHYTGKKGEAWLLSRGEAVVYLDEGAYPVSGTMEEHAAKTLALMDFEGTAVSAEGMGGYDTVALLQLWNEVPVRTCRMEVTYFEGSLRAVTGTRLSGTPVSAGEVELSAVTGLLRFAEQLRAAGGVCSEIYTMQAEYQLNTSLSEPYTLTPVWYFETDGGSYVLDVMSNQLKKL